MLNRSQKGEIIDGLKKDIEAARAIFLTNLIGVSSNDAVAIRKGVRDHDGKVVVTRNTLFGKASEGTYAESLLANLKGPHAVAFAFEDAPGVAKTLKKAGEDHDVIELIGGFLNGEELTRAQVNELASLPSRDEMLATVLATMQAPVSSFARLMNAIKDECEAQGVENPSGLKMEAAASEE
ncbi:50S ribosomal protein L10 [Bacteriovoracaceae bacterium]|nr:50S ribosomal protein L10 [Bacteriovoracaceae bacterium]